MFRAEIIYDLCSLIVLTARFFFFLASKVEYVTIVLSLSCISATDMVQGALVPHLQTGICKRNRK